MPVCILLEIYKPKVGQAKAHILFVKQIASREASQLGPEECFSLILAVSSQYTPACRSRNCIVETMLYGLTALFM